MVGFGSLGVLICLFRWCDGPGTTGGRGPKEKEGERGAHVSGCPTPLPSPFYTKEGGEAFNENI